MVHRSWSADNLPRGLNRITDWVGNRCTQRHPREDCLLSLPRVDYPNLVMASSYVSRFIQGPISAGSFSSSFSMTLTLTRRSEPM